MAKKKLTIKGITFPDFGKDKSKKNFRLIFYIGYTDNDDEEKAVIVSKPDSGEWQWKDDGDESFIPATIVGDSADLTVAVLKAGTAGIAAGSDKITEIDGKITDITVQFLDVFDGSFKDLFKGKILPEIIKHLQSLGINPIDLIPIPGAFTTIIKDKIKVDELATKFQEILTKANKDKILHTISAEYKNEKTLTLKQEKEWDKEKHKKGTYGVTIGIK